MEYFEWLSYSYHKIFHSLRIDFYKPTADCLYANVTKIDQALSKEISTSNFHSIEYFFVLFVCVFYVFLCGLLFAYILILILTKYMKSFQQKRLMDKNISLKIFNFSLEIRKENEKIFLKSLCLSISIVLYAIHNYSVHINT